MKKRESADFRSPEVGIAAFIPVPLHPRSLGFWISTFQILDSGFLDLFPFFIFLFLAVWVERVIKYFDIFKLMF